VTRIDAHHHVWRLARGDYGWLTPDLAPIHRDFAPDDLAPLLASRDIGATILVQAAPTEAETRFLLDTARTAPFVAGVVGWTDLAAPDAPDRVAALAADPLLVGLRPMVQDIADDDWLLRPALRLGLDAMARHGLVLDGLVLPRHLPRLAAVAARHPDLRIVVDHLGKPPVREGRTEAGGIAPWRRDLAALARLPNLWAKLSGLATEAAPDWGIADLAPYGAAALALFGPRRLVWGSDWPVVDLAGGYARWWTATEALLADLPEADRAAVLGGNAADLYLARGRGRRTGSPPC
jgi:L-fuconolactonase